MIIPLEQILEDDEVKRAICLMVQAELEKMDKSFSQKVHQLELSEQENFFLKSKMIELEREGLRKDVQVRELRRELQNERARIKIIVNAKRDSASSETYHSSDSTSSSPSVKRSLNFDAAPTLLNPSSYFKTQAHNDTPSIPEKVQNSFVHERDMTTEPDKWNCSCGTEFKCKPYLLRHIRYYHGDKKFKCSKCTNMQFALATDLRKHLKGAHKLPPAPWMRYACHDCGSFFGTGTELWAHRSKDHSKMFNSNLVPLPPMPSQIISLKNIKKEKEDAATSPVASKGNKTNTHRTQKLFHGFVKSSNMTVTKVSKKCTSIPKPKLLSH